VEPLRSSDASPIRPERLCKEINDILPSDGILVADTAYWLCGLEAWCIWRILSNAIFGQQAKWVGDFPLPSEESALRPIDLWCASLAMGAFGTT
jgi:hypothetical protein